MKLRKERRDPNRRVVAGVVVAAVVDRVAGDSEPLVDS
jgi:hypothetical protein